MWNIKIVVILLYMFLVIRFYKTLVNRTIIENAIYDYDLSPFGRPVGGKFLNPYKIMEPSYKTFWRLWDWGYTRIVPNDIYEMIRGFIDDD